MIGGDGVVGGGGSGHGEGRGELIRSVKKRIYFSFIGGACIGVFVTISLNFLTIARPVPGKTIHIKDGGICQGFTDHDTQCYFG